MTVVLDHLAIGTPALTDGWELFGGVLGGTWVYGMDSPGDWCGQLDFPAGPKIQLLTPTVGARAGAARRCGEALDGRREAADDGAAELTWPGGRRIRLVREDGLPLGGALHHVRFPRAGGAFSGQEQERAGLLAKRLGLSVELAR